MWIVNKVICDKAKNREKYKNEKRLWNLIISKPENHNLTRKGTTKIECYLNWEKKKKKGSFFADIKLQVDRNKGKILAKFNKQLFI